MYAIANYSEEDNMKKIISLLSVLIAVLVILGCKGGMGLSKAEVEKMIKES